MTHDGDFRDYRLIAARTVVRDEKACPPKPCVNNSGNRTECWKRPPCLRRAPGFRSRSDFSGVGSAGRPAVFPPVGHTDKYGFFRSSTPATAFILNRHERFCRFPINVIGLEEIDPLIFSIRDRHFRQPFSPLYSVTDSIIVGSEQEPTVPLAKLT